MTTADCELVKAAGLPVVAINDNYRLVPWAKYLYACDGSWWRVHYQGVKREFAGECWTQDESWRDWPGVRHIDSRDAVGLGDKYLVTGCNSGYQAINFAKIKGAERVLLLGYDMKGRGTHWFGKHDSGKGLVDDKNYRDFIVNFEAMRPERYDLEVINCTRDTALECFPRMTLEEALALP